MSEKPTPVIMLSAYTPKGAETTIKALQFGAVDYVCKPSGEISLDIKKVQAELIEKIKAAKNIDITKMPFILPSDIEPAKKENETAQKNEVMVIIATSTGGPRALTEVIPNIPRGLPASYLVVQHMSEGFTKTLAQRLNAASLIRVKEASQGEEIKAGTAYLAPGDFHMEISKKGADYCISLNKKPQRLGVRPCADMTLFSAAEVFEGKIIVAVLTGMGRDATAGVEMVRMKKGRIIAQDKETSVIYGMPKSVIDRGYADRILPLTSVASAIASEITAASEEAK
jgi:two-component system chemotaxis response regulator CheB